MLRSILLSTCLCAAVACSREAPGENTAQPADRPDKEQVADANAPEYGDWGVATDNIDETVAPGDDFYQHVNGAWLGSFKIPDEYSSYGSFTVLLERSENRLREIAEGAAASRSAAGSIERKIGEFYTAYLNEEAIKTAGLAPVEEDLIRFAALETHDDVAQVFARPEYPSGPVGVFVNVDAKAPDSYAVYVTQSGLGMPNRNYYRDAKFADKQAGYRAYIEKILTLAGASDADARAEAIYALEAAMADMHWSPEKRRERDLTYNPKTPVDLEAFAPGLPWPIYLEAAGVDGEDRYIVREDDAIAALSALFLETPVATWRDYLAFHLLNDYAEVLPPAFDEANFEFMSRTLRGTPKQKARWKRGVAALNDAMGEAVGKLYVERHFPQSSKAEMEALVANLRRALDERLDTLPWMSEETIAAAHEKLEQFTPKIGYPDKWRDYTDLEVSPDNAYANAKAAEIFAWNYSKSRLGGPVDKTEWGMNPQRVNAYYSAQRNEIVFPAAILQPPFFDPQADPAVNYGAIGAVIGHEIGHGFDDQGRKSDGAGMLRDWWSSEDAANFERLAAALGAQYAEYEPVEGFKVNPKLTMGENIGDLGGLSMAYQAYKLSLGGAEAPIINGYTGDQRFFMAWAQVWKRVVREEQLKNQIATDPHAPAQYRVNGVVRNMDAWYAAFGVTPENALYLPPEERVSIW